MRLTTKQIEALDRIAEGMSGAQFDAVHPTTRHALFRRGLIKINWLHPHSFGDVQYLMLTPEGKKQAGSALGWGH